MAVGNLSFSPINCLFSSLKASFKKDVPVEKNISPVLSDCLKLLTGSSVQRADGLIKTLDELVKFNPGKDYQPAYSAQGASQTLSLKWSVQHARDNSRSCPDAGRGEEYCESFLLDLMRSDYSVSKAGYCRLLDEASDVERLKVLYNYLSPHDLARVSEIAHQGHLAETANEAFEHKVSDGTHLFVQHSRPSHEITVGGQEAVLVTSTTSYALKDLDNEMLVRGLLLYATVTTRIGYRGGKLDHAALGLEPKRLDYELRYVVSNERENTAQAGSPSRDGLKV